MFAFRTVQQLKFGVNVLCDERETHFFHSDNKSTSWDEATCKELNPTIEEYNTFYDLGNLRVIYMFTKESTLSELLWYLMSSMIYVISVA